MRTGEGGHEHLDIDGCAIAFSDLRPANRPTIVFLHGVGCSRAVWAPVLERLPIEWRLIAYDLRGAGQSDESVERPLTLELWSSDLRALLGSLEVADRPVIVGHSLGASIALQFALDHPNVAGALALLGAEAGLCRLGPVMQARARSISEGGIHGWVTGPWRKAPPFSEASRAANPKLLDEYAKMLYETGAERYLRAATAIAESPDLTERVGEIDLASLVLIGGEDDRTLPSFGWELAKLLPNSRGVELPGVGHTLSFEAPRRVAEELVSFVDAIRVG